MRIIPFLFVGVVAVPAFAVITLTPGTEMTRSSDLPRSMSGLTWAGGDTYYTIAESSDATTEYVESWCLYKLTVTTKNGGRQIDTFRLENAGVGLEGCSDVEAVAFDPGSGNVWAADETGQTICEYDPKTGKRLRQAKFPAFLKDTHPWFGFESLAISGNGLTMWAMNEEGLNCDDTVSSPTKGTTVRLVKFTRTTVNNDWRCVAMYPYVTEKWNQRYSYGTAGRRGVSEIVALPDGSVLVLERELSSSADGDGLIAGALVSLYAAVYRVTPEAMSAATDVKDVPSLSADASWRPVAKDLLWSGKVGWCNYEAMCLGPRLSDTQCSLIALTDWGDNSFLSAKVLPLVLDGLPFDAKAETVAGGYRFADSFEGLAAGTAAAAIRGWDGFGCAVENATYEAPTPPGFVLGGEEHTRVLDAVGREVVRDVAGLLAGNDKIDVMMCVNPSECPLRPCADDVRFQLEVDSQGRINVWHRYEEEGTWCVGWTPLSETSYAAGTWVRVGIELDGTGHPEGRSLALVRVNGSCQPTDRGVRSPTNPVPFGPWYYLATEAVSGDASPFESLSFVNAKVDDLLVSDQTIKTEHAGPTSVDGIDFAWFDAAGLPRDPQWPARFLRGYTLGDIYAAGLDPHSGRPFEVTDFSIDAEMRLHIAFNGYKGKSPVGYRILRSSTPGFKDAVALDSSEGVFDGDATTRSTTWNGTSNAPDGTWFYKVEAFR